MFKFNLETVLKVRSQQETAKMRDLARARLEEKLVQDKIDQIHFDLDQMDENISSQKHRGNFSVDQLRFASLFRQRMKKELEERHVELKSKQDVVEEKRLALVEASKAKKVLEILKEKDEKKYWKQVAQAERKANDETAVKQFYRKHRS